MFIGIAFEANIASEDNTTVSKDGTFGCVCVCVCKWLCDITLYYSSNKGQLCDITLYYSSNKGRLCDITLYYSSNKGRLCDITLYYSSNKGRLYYWLKTFCK